MSVTRIPALNHAEVTSLPYRSLLKFSWVEWTPKRVPREQKLGLPEKSLTVMLEIPHGCCSALLVPTASAVMSIRVMLCTADVQRLDVSSEAKARISSVLYSVKFLFWATSTS